MPVVLSHFGTETVRLKKSDGTVHEVVGHVQPKLVVTENASTAIDEGDMIERDLPNGRIEIYEVLEANFYGDSSLMSAHYQCKVRKTSARSAQRQALAPQVSVTGDNARITFASGDARVVDNSSNAVTSAPTRNEVDLDQWRRDVAEILHMLASDQDKLEGQVNAAIWKIARVDPEQAESSLDLLKSVEQALTPAELGALAKLRALSSTLATNIVSSGLYEHVIAPIVSGLA